METERTLKLKHSEIELIVKALDGQFHSICKVINDKSIDLDNDTIEHIKINAKKYFDLCGDIIDSKKDV